MVYCRIYSVFHYFGLIVLCLVLISHQISHGGCGFVMHPLPDSDGCKSNVAFDIRHFLIVFIIVVFIIVVFIGFIFRTFSVLDDVQFPVQDVMVYFVLSSVFTIKTPQAVFFGLISPLVLMVGSILAVLAV